MNIPTGRDLLLAWADIKRKGVSMAQWADILGITRKALDSRIYQARKKYGDIDKQLPNDQISDIKTDNFRLVQVQGCEIKNPDQLIEKAKIDLDIWDIPEATVKSWPLGRRAEAKQVTYKNGRIVDGIIEDSGKLYMDMQYYVSLKLVKKKPEPIKPVIPYINIDLGKRKHKKPIQAPYKKALIVPDSQMGFRRDFNTGELTPFHDRRAHDIILQIASQYTWDAIVFLGDGLDYTEWTDRWVKEPAFYQTTKPALIEFSWFLGQICKASPHSKKYYIEGNHEDRANKYLMTHLQIGFGIHDLSLDHPYNLNTLLGLEQMNISLADNYPNGSIWLGDYVQCLHNTKLSGVPGMTATNMLKHTSYTQLAGHNHRLEQAEKKVTDASGERIVTAATCGCLCHIDYRVPGHKTGQHWQQGFATVYYGMVSPEVKLHRIDNGTAIYNDKIFEGVNYIEQLVKDTNYRF